MLLALDPWRPAFHLEWAVAIAIVALDYALYRRRLPPAERPERWRVAAFAAGLAVMAVALLSPVEHLALHSMLTFHLLQNVMIADWGPPLLLLGLAPGAARALERRALVRRLTEPRVALAVWLVVWYVVHLPPVYDYALRDRAALGLEHLAFIVSGLLFWWPDVVPGRLSQAGKLVYLFTAMVAMTPLDFAIYLAERPLYGFYLHTPKLGGMSALADQQLGAAATLVAESAVLVLAMCLVLARLLREEAAEPRAAPPPAPPR